MLPDAARAHYENYWLLARPMYVSDDCALAAIGKQDREGFAPNWAPRTSRPAQFGSPRLSMRNVLETDFLKAGEALEAIGVDCGAGSDVLSDEAVDRRCTEVRNDCHADAPRSFSPLLYGYQNEGGSAPLELTAPSDTGLGTSNPDIVDLYLTTKRFASDIHHRSPELVKHHPSGFVTPKPKLALKERRDALLSVVIR